MTELLLEATIQKPIWQIIMVFLIYLQNSIEERGGSLVE